MVIFTWIGQLVWAVISWNMYACWSFIIWTIGIITLPFRALSALHREKMTARNFEELQFEIENLIWNHRRLEAQFALAIKERKALESMLAEVEEEHDKAIVKIDQLEKQVHNLKIENLELRAVQGKSTWDFKSKDETKEAQTQTPSSSLTELPYTATREKISSTKGTRKDSLQKGTENIMKTNPIYSVYTEEALLQKRDIALSQSLFSALLSLLVGTVSYEAKDPCMPLVVALFVVVGMSLKSVVYFLSTIRNKPASDAIALLSFNWFILGTLTYPTLPVVARYLSPLVLGCIGWALGLFGFGATA